MKILMVLMPLAVFCLLDCSKPQEIELVEEPYQSVEVDPDVSIVSRPVKIEQIIGDFDRERQVPTNNQTESRYQLISTDLGVPFRHKDKTFVLFGDSFGAGLVNKDVIGFTTDTDPEDGVALDFIEDPLGNYRPLQIPGISQEGYEVPMEGVSIGDQMYLYHTTDHSAQVTMGRSVVALSTDDGLTFSYLYDLSTRHFINVSIVETVLSDWPVITGSDRELLFIFGSGTFRQSHVYLAYQFCEDIEDHSTIRYFTGLDNAGQPKWSVQETDAVALFNHPCVGELSVTYNQYLEKWIMLYNCNNPRGITLRTADAPWGPWTKSQLLFDPWADGGYGHFMHVSWESAKQDSVHDPGRENDWGGEYGPYQYESLATGINGLTTIFFNMSTWNPYTVVLMKATLQRNAQ